MRCYICDFNEVDASMSLSRKGIPLTTSSRNTVFFDKKVGKYICTDCATVVNITVYNMENGKARDDVE